MKKLLLIALTFLSVNAMADCEVQENARIALHIQAQRQAAESIRRHLPPFERYRVQRELSNAMQEVLRAHRQIEACAEYANTDKRRQLSRR